ncbi:hypothetical protein, partial [Paraburkholderia sp. BR10954]|uniref:hypothetical protein n=1 Tax=Paraburkholderia sp. BR10954 TaxID=3236995 RepID=UPI0034D20BA1
MGGKTAGFEGSELRTASDLGVNPLDYGRRDMPAICAQVVASKRFRRRKRVMRISDERDRPFRDRDRRFRQRDRLFRERDRADRMAGLALRMTS